MRANLICIIAFILLSVGLSPVLHADSLSVSDSDSGFDQTIRPFLAEHCIRCHGEEKQKGELRLDTLSRDFSGSGAGRWSDVIDRISSGEMPPKKEPKPKIEESTKIVEWLSAKLKESEAVRLAKRDRVSFYKLSREEYANTIRDLLGVHYDATDPTGLPEDPSWHGFERIGTVLSVSPAHIEKYFAAAESSLAEAFPPRPTLEPAVAKNAKPGAALSNPHSLQLHWSAMDLRGGGNKKELEQKGLLDKVRVDVWPGITFSGQPGGFRNLDIPVAGDYTWRIKLSGLKPASGRAPHVAVYLIDVDRMLFEQDVIATEDKPVTLEFTAHLTAGSHPLKLTNEAPGPSNLPRAGRNGNHPFFSIKQGREPWQTKLTDEAGLPILPFLIVDWMEIEGPIVGAGPTVAERDYLSTPEKDIPAARDILARFTERAFRRPVKSNELDRFVTLVESEMQHGESFDAALRTTFLAVLCSKDFFYLVEGSPERSLAKINDWELASRLSYFLWSTMPDGSLLDAARNGTLHEPDVLRAQIQRMVGDPRIERFSNAFSRQWLQLGRVGMFPPDKKIYPDYDDYLQKSMIGETTSFFHEVVTRNLSLSECLDSNWTMLNSRLAEHYGIKNITEDYFQRVALHPDDHRGGLLTMASILSLTSDGTRHRPVHRGKWVLESIIGKPPPPPPANVKPIELTPPTGKKLTLRQKIAGHRSDPSCAACHVKIDPLGLAFDNYDAIGRWRTEEAVRDGTGENPTVDASGELVDGRKFDGPKELKQILVSDIDKFNSAFVEKLATFALRRGMTVDDRASLADIARQSKESNYHLQRIIENLVVSDLFQKR